MLAPVKSERLLDELIGQAVASIEAAEFSALPYPHIVFHDFFPRAFYQDLIHNVPTQGYEPITASRSRMALRLYGDHVKGIERELQPMWDAVSAMLVSPQLEDAIRRRLHAGLEIRARGDKVASAADLKLVAKPVVYRDTDGY